MECRPPSTWIISPVVAGNQSDSRATTALAVGAESVGSQPSGAREAQMSSKDSAPGMAFFAIV